MKRSIFILVLLLSSVYAQQPSDVRKIDSMVAEINGISFTQTVIINDTNTILSGMKEQQIIGYLDNGEIKKVVVTFRNSNRIREIYNGPGKEYANKAIYIKDYDSVTLALLAEVYVWNRKLLKSIVTDPLNADEIMKPERLIQRAQYDYFIKYKLENPGQ